MNWTNLKDHGLPRRKIETKRGLRMMEATIELLCYDGQTVWHDFYDPEMDAEHFYKNVTHYCRVDEIPTP